MHFECLLTEPYEASRRPSLEMLPGALAVLDVELEERMSEFFQEPGLCRVVFIDEIDGLG
ncbi:hypothetical protein D3C71_1854680 [compost metagenome]